MNLFSRQPEPKEERDYDMSMPVFEYSEEDEVRRLTREKMVGWGIPYNLFPSLTDAVRKSDSSIVGMVSLYVGDCTLSNGVVCSEHWTREQRKQFVREEILNMRRDDQGMLSIR